MCVLYQVSWIQSELAPVFSTATQHFDVSADNRGPSGALTALADC